MHIGHYISGSAHIGLLGWMLLGGVFQSEQLPVDVSNVSVVSLSEYADIVMTDRAPEAELQPQDLMQPETEADPLPERPSQEQAVENIPQPELMVQPEETSRSAPQTPDPLLIPTPEVTEPTKLAAPQSNDAAFIVPRSAPAPRPQPDKRIAPKPVAPPPPDVAQEDQLRQAAAPSENPAAVPQPEVDATAPEEAARESLAETDTPPKMAPDSSVRPQARPALPEPPKAPEPSPEIANQSPDPVQAPEPEPKPTPQEDPIQAALQEAMQGGSEPSEATGPALTKDEKEGLRDDVQACWIVDEGSLVSNVTVTVAMSMTPEGKVKGGSLRLISGEGGSDRAKKIAFEAARRAILRCQKKGYDLPKEKYEHWREIEIIFDPESRTR